MITTIDCSVRQTAVCMYVYDGQWTSLHGA